MDIRNGGEKITAFEGDWFVMQDSELFEPDRLRRLTIKGGVVCWADRPDGSARLDRAVGGFRVSFAPLPATFRESEGRSWERLHISQPSETGLAEALLECAMAPTRIDTPWVIDSWSDRVMLIRQNSPAYFHYMRIARDVVDATAA